MSDFINFMREFRKLPETERQKLTKFSKYLSEAELKYVEKLLKQKVIDIELVKPSYSNFLDAPSKPTIKVIQSETEQIKKIKSKLNQKYSEKIFSLISKTEIDKFVAPNIVGMDDVKKAAALILFSKEPFHLLLLGDPGTGKTDIISSIDKYSPISSFGLGSGTSGVGLAVTVQGNEVKPGLLPLANNGIACIDELNLMKEENRASLYNAMEKGFVSYDKAGKHIKFDAKISVAATANPKGDKFSGKTIEKLDKQLPFDSALLTRFHLLFLVRKPSLKEFKEISKKIIAGNKVNVTDEFEKIIKDYIKKARQIKVSLPKELEKEIVDFVEELKLTEKNYLTEISPRLVVGFVRMAQAKARMRLRNEVTRDDIKYVQDIIESSLKIGVKES